MPLLNHSFLGLKPRAAAPCYGVLHCRFAGESFLTGASSTQLSTKLLSLLQDCICTHLFPELQRRLDKLKAAVTPAAKMLLKKGRRWGADAAWRPHTAAGWIMQPFYRLLAALPVLSKPNNMQLQAHA